MATPLPLSIDLLRLDGDTQSRLAIHEETVSNYSERITENGKTWPFPPVDVFHDGADYFVADGFHRVLAGQRAKRGSIPCIVHKGTARDARIFGMTANDKHGLRMSHADKRACVEWLLDQPEKMTQADIAEKAGVSVSTVRNVVADRRPLSVSTEKANRQKGKLPFNHPQVASDPFDVDPSEPEETVVDVPAEPFDYGKCPNCAGSRWDTDDDGVSCSKCYHPHGEPAGDVDEDRLKTQRQKTVKTVEALMRAFDDLQTMKARAAHAEAIVACKGLLNVAKGWK